MNTYKEFCEINEAKDEFANMNTMDILAKIANGKDTKKVDSVTINPKQAKALHGLISDMDTKTKKQLLKKDLKGIMKVLASMT